MVCRFQSASSYSISGSFTNSYHLLAQESITATPRMIAITEQFPWATMRKQNTYNFTFLHLSKGLYGTGRAYGWWSVRPCCGSRGSDYTWGAQLLENQHLREREGWRLPDSHIPWLDFALSGRTPPRLPLNFEHSWASYYAWRGLPMDSLACFRLHWPLTVYRLLYLLGLVPSEPPQHRRRLTIHYLDVDEELDSVPV